MTIVDPVWLLLSGLTFLVLLLHMQRRRTLAVPSILIWEKLASPVQPRSALRLPPFSWTLVLQIAVVLFAAAAFARPLLGGTPLPDHRVVMVDASGSMRATDVAETRFVAAVDRARGMLRSIPPTTASRVSVVVVGGEPHLLAARYAGDRGLLAALGAVEPTDGSADWASAADLVRSVAMAGESVGIAILTDDGNAAGLVSASLPNADVSVVPFRADPSPGNAGLTASVTAPEETGEAWHVGGTVSFTGDLRQVTVRMLFQPEGSEGFLDWASSEVTAAEGSATASFEKDLDLPGAGILAVALPEDLAPHDNRLQFVLLGEPRRARVLHLGPSNPPLERALLASDVLDLFAADGLPPDDASFDLVIVDNIALDRRPASNTLFLGMGRIAGEPEPTGIAGPVPSFWDAGHPLAHAVDWADLEAAVGYRLPVSPGASVILEAAGAPLLQARTVQTGREIRFGVDLRGGAWSEDPGFPVFVGNILRWLGLPLGQEVAPGCSAGVACPVDPRLAFGAVLAPDGTRTDLSPGVAAGSDVLPLDHEAAFTPRLAGIYRIEAEGRAQLIAVNPPAGEIGLPGASTGAEAPAEAEPPTPLRWWLLALMLVALAAEAWIAGRGSERFLQRAALMQSTPFYGRRRALLGLRVASILLALAALADLRLPILPTSEEVIAIAAPDNIPGLERQLNSAGAKTAVVVLAATPSVQADIGSATGPPIVAPAGADVERAIEVADALLPADRPGRIVLSTAGAETRGDMLAAHALARPVDVMATTLRDDTIVVSSISAPSPLFAGDSFPLTALVFSTTDGPAGLRVSRDGETLVEQSVSLLSGWNRLETIVREAPAGEALYEVSVAADSDPQPADNRNGVWLNVEDGPNIAILSPDRDAGERLVEALAVQGLNAKVVHPSVGLWSLGYWLGYDAFVLANTPAIDFTTEQMEHLETAVRDYGRGLVILGGENAFGPGGYYQTPLERLSPLSSRVPRDAPKVALAFVLDRSGSMQQRIGDVSRLDIAKQAALNAIELLQAEAEVTIVVFDSEARLLVPLRPNNDLPGTAAALALLDTGGGTSIYPGMALAFEELSQSDAAARHMIVMTDGLSEPGDFGTLIRQIGAEGITVSTVAIGDGADSILLEALARMGAGAFHQTTDFAALPSILSLEAMMLSGAPMEEHPALPVWHDRDRPFLAGLPASLPAISGFVLTTAKPDADLHLTVPDVDGEDMPLLASWRYGNGQVAAFTSHGAGAWTADWMAAPQFPLLWGQIVRHFLPHAERGELSLDLTRDGDEVVVEALADDGQGKRRQDLQLVAAIGPRGAEQTDATTTLREVAPGRYLGRLPAAAPGDYTVTIEGGPEVRAQSAFHVAFPAILDQTRYRPARAVSLASLSGGRYLADDPWASSGVRSGWTWHPGWPAFTLLALVLFLADLVIRYAPGLLRRRSRAIAPG